MSDPTGNIVDLIPNTVRVPRTDLRKTDVVFDTFGGYLPLLTVRQYKNTTVGTRFDGVKFWLTGDDTITVLRGTP